MKRFAQSAPFVALPVALAVALSVGCAGPTATALTQPAAPRASSSDSPPSRGVSPSAPIRHVGDLFVHRFSGSFASEPLTLSEEVTQREEQAWVVDFSLTQGEQVERLRVRFDAESGEPRSVARLVGTKETPAGLSDYEALMARTVYAADVNDGLVSTHGQTCLVGSDEHQCETKTYKVWVGDRAATLAVVHAERFADRDVSGEITTDDGRLVYRAELLEAREGTTAQGVAAR